MGGRGSSSGKRTVSSKEPGMSAKETAGSKIQKWDKKRIKEMAETGTMPLYIQTGGTTENYNKVYEYINKTYAMPDAEYLKKAGIGGLNEGWNAREISQTDPYGRTTRTGEYSLSKRLFATNYDGVHSLSTTMTSPLEASREARIGMEKYALYRMLSDMDRLDKTQFMRKK